MGTLKYKGYVGSVEFSEEDGCLYGKVLGMGGNCITYEGQSVEELRSDFKGAVDFYLDCCRERGVEPKKSYSGRLVLRMSSDFHGQVADAARSAGTTINEFINRALQNEMSHHSAFSS
ncbi:MAG: type II toxin-antitoxin system HicB family antitoxin [Candidatus Amulumruptor caecigallinarius]|nr:type II toxin-antitoxin system HicB family antitoxin [Candidatus Amulumruptor caecigallinarius]MCM1395952.1 type II toxin-antitoxin system HicB family antitoxin [Candidatus Amulumruptor caecigallinarius]MCM1452987.1 type II toxin-antitoxin system HicB family antitoxin [bacterium]